MSSVTPETKLALPSGHPRAGYTRLAHDEVANTGTVPDTEQDWYDLRVSEAKTVNDAIAEHEHQVALEEAAEAEPKEEAPVAKSSVGSSKGTSSSGSS